jgi:hypothetical protein
VQTETSVKTAKNPGMQSFSVPVWYFRLLGKGRPVMVMVKAPQHQKTRLDWTFKNWLKSQFQQYQPAKYVYFRTLKYRLILLNMQIPAGVINDFSTNMSRNM